MPFRRQQAYIVSILFFVLGLTVAVYWPGLGGPLLLDDKPNLAVLETLESPLVEPADIIFSNQSGPLGRPVSVASFVANYLTSGQHVWFFKYTNLMIHLLTGCLLIWLTGCLLKDTFSDKERWMLALWVGGLWLLSPFLVSTVLYTVQRMAQLSALFVLAGCVTYVIGRSKLASAPWLGVVLTLSSLVIWTPLAVLSKENGALLPLFLLLIEWFFFQFTGPPFARRYLKGFFGLTVVVPACAVLIALTLKWNYFGGGYLTRDFSLSERLLTQPRILLDYLASLILPLKSGSFGLFHDDFPVSRGLLEPPTTLLAIVFWVFLLGICFSARSRPARAAAFGLMFFVAGHLIESTFIPLELYFEHRNYLPGMGVYLSLGVGLIVLAQKFRHRQVIAVFASCFFLITAVVTYQRTQTWSSKELLVLSAQQFHPESSRLNTELANIYSAHGQFEEAIHHVDAAKRLSSYLYWGPAMHRLLIHCANERPVPPDAYSVPQLPQSYTPSHKDQVYAVVVLQSLNRHLQKNSCKHLDTQRLADMINSWIRVIPDSYRGRTHKLILAHASTTLGLADRVDSQLDLLMEIIAIYPEYTQAKLSAIHLLLKRGDINTSRTLLTEAMNNNPDKQAYITNLLQGYDKLLNQIIPRIQESLIADSDSST